MRRTIAAALLTALTIAGLTGCMGGISNTPAEPGGPAPKASSTAADDGEDKTLSKKFGSTFTWDDGASITVSKPKAFKPSEYSSSQKFKDHVIMDVTIKNGSDKPIEAILFGTQATTGDAEAEAVFDGEKGVDLPTSKVLPGKSLKYKIAFGVKKGEDFVLSVSYDFGNTDGIYQD